MDKFLEFSEASNHSAMLLIQRRFSTAVDDRYGCVITLNIFSFVQLDFQAPERMLD